MQSCPPCAICCSICAQKQSQPPLTCAFNDPTTKTKEPFALRNLLAAGIITIKRVFQSEPSLCDHIHADDGWHEFDGQLHSGYLGQDHAMLAKQLWYLVRHDFIRTTYNIISEETLVLRIYIIPVDLKNVQGRLHHNNRAENILSSARRYLRSLLPKIFQDNNQWYGHPSEGSLSSRTLIDAPPDDRTLAEIYGDLVSPSPNPYNVCNNIVARLLNFDDDLEGFGFRSVLYRYQRHSIAAMITRELDLRDVPDPLYLPISTMDDKEYYFQPGTLEFMTERAKVAPTRGGLLCEELGTGKTVMILGLILSTLNQLPSPPETTAEPPIILTPVSLGTFPSGPHEAARESILGKRRSVIDNPSRVPSLVELMLHHTRITPPPDLPDPTTPRGRLLYENRLEVESRFEMTSLNDLLHHNIPFYLDIPEEYKEYPSWRKTKNSLGPRIKYLSAATLVVVPPNLLSQWHREINKHCERHLRVLILRSGTKTPPAKCLANDYDIILMTYNRYSAEAVHKETSRLHSVPPCKCPDIPGSRIPNCKCPPPTGVSPFLQVRWKRLVIDEGHVSARLSTNLTPFTKLLGVERRWIVTGTPTTNLLGLSLGKNTISESVSHTEQFFSDDDQTSATEENSIDITSTSDQETSKTKHRIWNKYDREDLNKLDNMITHFIAVPHFIANSKLMSTHLRDPLMDQKGPRPGSIQVLNQVMEMIMIRHRIEDVEKDIVLPSVVHESILLDLDPIVTKSYNALQATIAINAIDSQRTDQDYLFHPKNTEYLQVTVKNMSQLMFWSVDEELYNVDLLVENAQATIDRAIQRNMPPEDIQLVQIAFKHIQKAATDQLWRQIQTHEDVPYHVHNMSQGIMSAWTRTPGANQVDGFITAGMVHADRLLKLQSAVTSQPLISEQLLIKQGTEVAKTDEELRRAFEESYKRNKNKHSRKYTQNNSKAGTVMSSEATEVHAGYMVENATKKAMAPDTLKEMRKELDQSLAKLEREEGSPPASGIMTSSFDANVEDFSKNMSSVLLRSSVLANVAISSSASSKLNYIVNEVLEHSANEKILIFSDSELTLAHVSEALELIRVKFLRFTTQIQPQVREQLVLTFETSETYRVFLMELKHGSRGLNLISASRVIFCEPVWQPDVESQAIKRAHRIGQTRPITVKTLAIRGTAEETMVERRNLFKGSQDKIPKLIEESGMRHFIANPKFLTHDPEMLPRFELPLLHLPEPPTPPSTGSLQLNIPNLHLPPSPSPRVASSSNRNPIILEHPLDEQDNARTTVEDLRPKKKAKMVHFS